jgi:hypothetical protein
MVHAQSNPYGFEVRSIKADFASLASEPAGRRTARGGIQPRGNVEARRVRRVILGPGHTSRASGPRRAVWLPERHQRLGREESARHPQPV